jgi:hypothetical protein
MVDSSQPVRSLEDLWPLQAALNARAGFDTRGMGDALAGVTDIDTVDDDTLVALGKAVKNYIDAMASECHELQDCLAWKHWYREAKEGKQHILQDLQNARVEVVDMLFFWISLCQLLGMGPDDVYRLYEAKLGINHNRQDENRTQAEHSQHEDENRTVE